MTVSKQSKRFICSILMLTLFLQSSLASWKPQGRFGKRLDTSILLSMLLIFYSIFLLRCLFSVIIVLLVYHLYLFCIPAVLMSIYHDLSKIAYIDIKFDSQTIFIENSPAANMYYLCIDRKIIGCFNYHATYEQK